MNDDVRIIVEIWDIFRDHVPTAKRPEAAIQMLKAFEEYGFDPTQLQDLADEDRYLHRAFHDLYADEIEDEEDQIVDDE